MITLDSKMQKGEKRDEKQEVMDIWGNHSFDCNPESYFWMVFLHKHC